MFPVHVFPIIGVKVCHDKVITRFLPEPATCQSVQNDVESQVTPPTVAVHGLAHVLKISPVPRLFHVIGCTQNPLNPKLSCLFVQFTVIFTVTVVSVIVAELTVKLDPPYGIDQEPDLNLRLFGNVRINVVFDCRGKSLFNPSVIIMVDNFIRHDPYAEFPAVSAEIFVPPFAAVTTTVK